MAPHTHHGRKPALFLFPLSTLIPFLSYFFLLFQVSRKEREKERKREGLRNILTGCGPTGTRRQRSTALICPCDHYNQITIPHRERPMKHLKDSGNLFSELSSAIVVARARPARSALLRHQSYQPVSLQSISILDFAICNRPFAIVIIFQPIRHDVSAPLSRKVFISWETIDDLQSMVLRD